MDIKLEVVDSVGVVGTIKSLTIMGDKIQVKMDETFHEVATTSPQENKLKYWLKTCPWKELDDWTFKPFGE